MVNSNGPEGITGKSTAPSPRAGRGSLGFGPAGGPPSQLSFLLRLILDPWTRGLWHAGQRGGGGRGETSPQSSRKALGSHIQPAVWGRDGSYSFSNAYGCQTLMQTFGWATSPSCRWRAGKGWLDECLVWEPGQKTSPHPTIVFLFFFFINLFIFGRVGSLLLCTDFL